jgi:hypothetical protein
MTPTQLIAFLNAMTCGDLDSIATKLEEARAACVGLGESGLSDKLVEAKGALVVGDLKTFRKRVQTVVSDLGHVRSRRKSLAGSTSGRE